MVGVESLVNFEHTSKISPKVSMHSNRGLIKMEHQAIFGSVSVYAKIWEINYVKSLDGLIPRL